MADSATFTTEVTIEVEGLDQFRRDLRAMGREYRNAWDSEVRKIGRPIAADAKRRYRKEHPRRRGGRGSQRGIRSTARQGAAVLSIGSARYPYLLGQEFGSGHYPQFPSYDKEGRFFFPAIIEGAAEVPERFQSAMDNINARFGWTPDGQ